MMIKKTFTIATGSIDSDHDIIMPGAIKMPEGSTVKILDHFDASKPVGVITEIKQDSNDIVATGMFREDPTGLYPAIGFQVIKSHENMHGGRTIEELKLYCVGVCPGPNADPNVKPIQ